MSQTVTVTINGKKITTHQGASVLEVAEENGINIPRLCYHPMLESTGACRLCVVEVEKARTLQPACTTPVVDGMVIHTESPRVIDARKTVIDLLLANHPEDCLTCEKNGDCELQNYAYQYGIKHTSYKGERKNYPILDDNPFYQMDPEKCILCGRCVRMCDEVVAHHVWDYSFRGFVTKVTTAYDMPVEEGNCIFCGNCVQACPTGALLPKYGMGKARSWEVTKVRTVCPYCGVGCNIYLHVKNNEVIKVTGAEGGPNDTLLCVKGRFGFDFINHKDRLKTPLIKGEDGQFREASWDEALDLVARRFTEIKEKYGPEAFGGLSSARATNEENYLMQKFMRAVIGTNNIDHCARLCHSSSVVGLNISLGSAAMTNSIADLEEADVIFIIGSNTTEAHPVIGMRLNRPLRKGAKLIVADPRKTEFAERAHVFLQQLPGTDVALLNAMAHVIIKEERYDKEFVAKRTEGFEDLVKFLEPYTLEYAEKVTGIPKEEIIKAARIYAEGKNATILYAMGITQHTTGVDNVQAIANLALLTGNIGREGTGVNPLRGQNNVQGSSDMCALPNLLPGYMPVTDPGMRATFEKAWGVALSSRPGLTVVEMIHAAEKGEIKAMYIMGENPMVSDPDIQHVEEGLRNLEFLVVQDIFLSETAQLAHVVLPAVSFAEKTGTFTNTERRIQLIRKAIEPIGQAKPDWWIIQELARRMGYPMNYASPEDVMAEISALVPIYGGVTYERLGTQGLQWPIPDKNHPGTKILHRDRFTRGLGLLARVPYKEPDEGPDEEYPLILTTGRILYHYHTGTMTRRSKGLHTIRPEGYMEIHPDTAARYGVKDGQWVKVTSKRGQIRIKAQVTAKMHPKAVFIPFHFVEAAANMLTNPALDPQAKIPEYKVAAVRVEPEA